MPTLQVPHLSLSVTLPSPPPALAWALRCREARSPAGDHTGVQAHLWELFLVTEHKGIVDRTEVNDHPQSTLTGLQVECAATVILGDLDLRLSEDLAGLTLEDIALLEPRGNLRDLTYEGYCNAYAAHGTLRWPELIVTPA